MDNIKENFYSKFNKLEKKVTAENTYFSFSKVRKKLLNLFPLAKEIGEDSKEMFELYYLYTLVLSKKSGYEKELILYSNKYNYIFKKSEFLTPHKKMYLKYRLYKAYENLSKLNLAVVNLNSFIKIAQKYGYLSQRKILAQKEQLAYLYHKKGSYKRALKINKKILEKAQEMGVDEELFMNLYNNIAQNYYKLDNTISTICSLNKRLKLSKKYNNLDVELNTLFQLAVINFEEGDFDESEKLFISRIKLAKVNPNNVDAQQLEDIKSDLDQFYIKRNKLNF